MKFLILQASLCGKQQNSRFQVYKYKLIMQNSLIHNCTKSLSTLQNSLNSELTKIMFCSRWSNFARTTIGVSFVGITAAHCQSSDIITPPPTTPPPPPTSTKNNYSTTNKRRQRVNNLVEKLQKRFVEKLQDFDDHSGGQEFYPVSWLRDEGRHGGGTRYQSPLNSTTFAQATVNVSSVHFQDLAKYPIDSATALSVIVHPRHPRAPSMHFHISFMEPRQGKPYWRMIADLNPAIPEVEDTNTFTTALENVQHMSTSLYDDSKVFGNKYFYIPSLGRHRGTCHFFIGKLEEDEINFEDGCEMALDLAETAIVTYTNIVERAMSTSSLKDITKEEKEQQLAYHTLYLYQVLTLDRGTTHGLMAHDQNDVGTLGSLPPAIDRELLKYWSERAPPPQNQLVSTVLNIIPADGSITDATRGKLASVVRQHYRMNAEARKQQADLDLKWWAEKTKERVVKNTGLPAPGAAPQVQHAVVPKPKVDEYILKL